MDQRFLYQAHAVGFSGRITRPFHELIEARATCALPGSGGIARSFAGSFRHKGIFRFESARSMVTGSPGKDGFDTLISASVEKLNILDNVTADRVVAHMTSHHGADGSQPVITPRGSHFEGLRIAGYPLEVDLNAPTFCKQQDYDALCGDLSKEANGRTYATSLVTDLPTIPGLDPPVGNKYWIPQFGTVHIATYVVSPYARRLIMLRVELGCPFEGECDICEIDGNGSDFPPE